MSDQFDAERLPWENLGDCVRIDSPGSAYHHIEVCEISQWLPDRAKVGRLIAAAPELLASLMEIVYVGGNWFPAEMVERAKAAITKAT